MPSFEQGDAVLSRKGHIWTCFVGVLGHQIADAPDVPHVFLIRQKGDDLIYCLQRTDAVTKLDYVQPLVPGDTVFYEGDKMELIKLSGLFAFLRDSDGRITAAHRWELALIGRLSRPCSVLCCDWRQADPEEI
jgi:hypothetical protein